MTRAQRIENRNQQVREYFSELEKKYPEWKLSALLEKTAKKFPPISSATVSAILKQTGCYAENV